jgi:glycosyltransferase involved in cell wall biosynthesis
MSKLKIAFFSDMLMRDYDGCMRTVFHIIDRKPKSVDIKYFTGQGTVRGLNQPAVTIPNVTIPFNNDYKIALPQLAYFKIRREIEAYSPDIIHITTPSMLGHFALQIAKEKGIPVSTIYHTHYISYVNYYLENLKPVVPIAEKLMKNSTMSFYNKCDLILVPTQEMIDTLQEVGVNKDKMRIWKRGIDSKVFNCTCRDKNYVRQITGNDHFNILFASRLVWEKNLKTLVKIYKQAEKQNLKVNFIIAGSGTAYGSLTQEMPNAFFLGRIGQTQLAKLYASCDSFVFPSVSETYGNVVLEAMACGLPCVIANGGGSKSFIKHGENGFLCEPFDEMDYLQHIKKLMSDPILKNQIISNGLKYAQGYDWDALTNDFYCSLGLLAVGQDKMMVSLTKIGC